MTEEELRKIPGIGRDILRKIERLSYLEAKAETIPAVVPKERVQCSPVARGNLAADLAIDLSREIAKEQETLRELQSRAEEIFQGSSSLDFDEQQLLKLRYLYCMNWDQIAGYMCLTLRGTYKMHGRALAKMFSQAEKSSL